jgi:NarL family two-component system response regulator LiaR
MLWVNLFEDGATMYAPTVLAHHTRNAMSMIKPNTVRVMIVDDHDMVRKGLAVFLEAFDDLELVGEAANGQEAVRLCAEVQPHVVLMDLVMPEMDGIAATRAIRQVRPDVKVIVLTSFGDQDFVQRALQAGAIGYLLKNASIDEIASAIRMAHNRSAP